MSDQNLEARFEDLDRKRSNKLERAYQCAELTIPGLFTREGFSQTCELYQPYQSDGARGVTRLASRLTSSHVPLNDISYFQFYVDPLDAGTFDTSDIDQELERRERKIRRRLSLTNLRQALYTAEQHLIVVGDCLWHQSDEFEFQVFKLDQYVVRRNPKGRPVETILQEWVVVETLDQDIQDKVRNENQSSFTKNEEWEPLYSQMLWNPETKKWDVKKELRGVVIEEGSFDIIPYIPLTWTVVAGEDYGRSLCEENIGDLRTLESLSKSFIQSAAANAEWRVVIHPGGMTEADDWVMSNNGDVIPGREEDVWIAQLGSPIHLQTTADSLNRVKRDLGATFLLNSATRRDAERVTAEEIRADAQEVDQGLGGVLSTQNRELMPLIIRRSVILMQKEGTLEKELKVGEDELVKLKIRTGLEAVGRDIENAKLSQFGQEAVAVPQLAERVKWGNFINRLLTARGVETEGLIVSDEEWAAMQQQQMEQQLALQGAGQAISSAGTIAEQNAKGEA